jgi:hypothetical protein
MEFPCGQLMGCLDEPVQSGACAKIMKQNLEENISVNQKVIYTSHTEQPKGFLVT